MISFNPSTCAHYRSRLVQRSLIAVGLLLVAPLVWAAPYAYIANRCASNTCNNGAVSVIDTATNTVTATVPVGSLPQGVTVSPDGSRVYVANYCGSNSTCNSNGTVSVIDTATNTVTATVPVGTHPQGVAVSPDGSRVYVANVGSSSVSVIDTTTNAVTATVTVGGASIVSVAVSPDGSRVYATNAGNAVSVIDTATNTVTATVPVGNFPAGVAVSPDGRRVYVANQCGSSSTCNGNGTVSVIDTTTNTVTATVSVGINSTSVAVSPDGSQVYVTNKNGNTVSVIDTTTNTVTATVPVGTGPIGVAVSPDGSRVYVVNLNSNTVSVIDTATDATAGTPIAVGSLPNSLGAFVGPGALIAANSSASGGAMSQISSTVPTLTNSTACATTDALVQSPSEGTVTFSDSTGAFTYTPTSTTYSGPDAFTWQGQAPGCTAAKAPTTEVSNTATVALTLNPLLSGLGNVTLGEGQSTSEAFTLTGSTPFTHTLASDDATVLPPADVTILSATCGTTGTLSCTLGLTAATAPGTASLSVTATDKYSDPVKKTLLVTVVAPPTLSGLSSVSIAAAQNGSETFTLSGTGGLTVTTTSANATLLPNSGITGASACTAAGSCTLTLKPASDQSGNATVTVSVADGYGQSASGTFTLTVNKPAAPTLSSLSSVNLSVGQSGSEKFTETGTGTLTVTAKSSNTTLLPNSGITGQSTCTGAGSCTLTLQPASGQSGTATVEVTVTDAYGQSATVSFDVTVQSSSTGGGGSSGGGVFSPWGLTLLAGLTLLIALGRKRDHAQQQLSNQLDKQ